MIYLFLTLIYMVALKQPADQSINYNTIQNYYSKYQTLRGTSNFSRRKSRAILHTKRDKFLSESSEVVCGG